MTRRYDYPPACDDHRSAIFVAVYSRYQLAGPDCGRHHAAEQPYKSTCLVASTRRLQRQADRDARPT